MLRLIFLITLAPTAFLAQNASLTGRVTDESGAIVAGATVTATGAAGARRSRSGPDGMYSINNLNGAAYTVAATAPQLTTRHPATLTLHAGPNTLNLELIVAVAAAGTHGHRQRRPCTSAPKHPVTPAPPSSKVRISMRSPTIPTIFRPISKRSPAPPPARAAEPSSSTASAAASSPKRIDPRDPHQLKPLLARVRQAGLRPHRNLHQAGHR